jgi:hypothetical protein
MFDALLDEKHCRRCGTPLDGQHQDGAAPLLDCPRCRRVALSAKLPVAVNENQIVVWLDENSERRVADR